jgi:hypothetical protein
MLNFGDELSPEIIEYITGRKVQKVNNKKCELIALGSILDNQFKLYNKFNDKFKSLIGRPTYVWGSGVISNETKGKTYFRPLALRGHLTKNKIGIESVENIPLGDPGLFIFDMINSKSKKSGVGIIPHYTDKKHPLINDFKYMHNVKIIDVETPWRQVCNEIASCDFILSSSLHGLVVADAFKIPNYRIKLYNNLKGGSFKFKDYASALNRVDINSYEISGYEGISNIKKLETDFSYQSSIDEICAKLEKVLKKTF